MESNCCCGSREGASNRLTDLKKLIESPVVPLVFAQAAALSEQGKRVRVGISTNEAVTEGADPTICIVIDPTHHGEFGNGFHPQRWDYKRVDLIGRRSGYDLRVTIEGDSSKFRESGIPHKITSMENIEYALNQALTRPRYESTRDGQDLNGFPVIGFERLATPATQ